GARRLQRRRSGGGRTVYGGAPHRPPHCQDHRPPRAGAPGGDRRSPRRQGVVLPRRIHRVGAPLLRPPRRVKDPMAEALILIVEDNDKNLKLARDLLRHDGLRTLEADTAATGIALAEQHVPDLILMDIQLPDMDGVAALGRLRASAATRSIPVVALTAFAMAADRERLLAAGFDGYMAKPIDIHDFSDRARDYCKSTGRPPPQSWL